MTIIRTISELMRFIGSLNGRVHFIPTMGALHHGHAKLISSAAANAKKGDAVVVSSFVNPLQFNNPDDLKNYPRNEAEDIKISKQAGCTVFFAPDAAEIYPPHGANVEINVGGVAQKWEGEHRPGHFNGVATVVAKLFNIVMPDIAYFGEKDWQQVQVVKSLVDGLNFPVDISVVGTVREKDMLAASSRNLLLNPGARVNANALFYSLVWLCKCMRDGADLQKSEEEARARLLSAGFSSVDYLAIVDENSLEPTTNPLNARAIGAAVIGGVRLIDNVAYSEAIAVK